MGDRRAAGGSGKLGSLSKGDGRAGLGKTEAGRAHPGDLVYVRLKPGRGWGRGSGVERLLTIQKALGLMSSTEKKNIYRDIAQW